MALKSATAGPDINLEMLSWTRSLETKLVEKTSSVTDIFWLGENSSFSKGATMMIFDYEH